MAREVTLDDILTVVSKHFQIGKDLIRGKDKSKALVFPRQVSFYLMSRMTSHKYKDIGEFMSGVNFASIQNAVKAVKFPRSGRDLETDRIVIKLVGDIRVQADLEDPNPKPTMEALEDTIERLVQLYTRLQLEAERQAHESRKGPGS